MGMGSQGRAGTSPVATAGTLSPSLVQKRWGGVSNSSADGAGPSVGLKRLQAGGFSLSENRTRCAGSEGRAMTPPCRGCPQLSERRLRTQAQGGQRCHETPENLSRHLPSQGKSKVLPPKKKTPSSALPPQPSCWNAKLLPMPLLRL